MDAKIEFATITSQFLSLNYMVSFYITLLISALRNSLGYSDLLSSLLILLACSSCVIRPTIILLTIFLRRV